MDHSDVVEPDEGPVGSHSQVVVVTRVDGQTFGFHELPTVLRQIDQHLRAFTALSQIVLPDGNNTDTELKTA